MPPLKVQLSINAGLPAYGPIQVAIGDTVTASLDGAPPGGATLQWFLIGRPEDSSAGGVGPLPISLGTSPTSTTFTVDNDAGGVARDGTYIVGCLVGANLTPDQRQFPRGSVFRPTGTFLDDGNNPVQLRKPAPFERKDDVDTEVGSAFIQIRWLDLVWKTATRLATATVAGLMSAVDKSRFDNLLSIQDQGIPIAGGPFTTLNVVGPDIVISDGGGGVALLSHTNPPGGGPGAPETGTYTRAPAVVVNDVVYVSAADTVDQADADGVGTQPVIGFVQSLPNPTDAVVQYNGELGGFVGLTVGATYFLSLTPGLITDDVSLFPPGSIVQKLGFARNSTTLVIQIDRDYVIL